MQYNPTKGELVRFAGLEERGSVDYAVPEAWADEVRRNDPVNGQKRVWASVWFYPFQGPGRTFGEPVDLSNFLPGYLKAKREEDLRDMLQRFGEGGLTEDETVGAILGIFAED